jgi:hypothetical protein
VFRLDHVRVNCTNAVKEKASFVTREQGGYCSTCAYSFDKTTFERSASYPKTQSGIKMLLYAAPHNPKYSSKKMRDHMITNPTHKFLTHGPLLDDAKYDIVFGNTGRYFISSHNLCKKPIVITLFYCGSISISYNMGLNLDDAKLNTIYGDISDKLNTINKFCCSRLVWYTCGIVQNKI